MAELSALFVILVLAALLRMLFIVTESSDNDWHLWKIKEARRGDTRFDFSHSVSNAMAEGWHVYANLHHSILALFNKRHWLIAGKFLNIAYDLFGVISIYVIARWWLLGAGAGARIGPLSAANALALLYATSPVLFPVTARFTAIGARVLGNTIALLYLAFLGYGLVHDKYSGYGVAAALVILSALTSQFGLQVIVLFSAVLSLFYLSAEPMLVVAVALGLGLLIRPLGIRRLLIGYWDFYRHYWRTWRRGSTGAGRNKLKDVLTLPSLFFKKPERALKLCFEKLTPIIALVSVPLIGFWIYWGITAPSEAYDVITESPVLTYSFAVACCGFLFFVLTSVEPMVILGAAERYFAYSIAFMEAVTVAFLLGRDDGASVLFWLVLLHLIGILAHWLFVERDWIKRATLHYLSSSFTEMVDFLKQQKGLRVLCVPTKHSYKISAEMLDSDACFYYDHLTLRDGGRRYMAEDRPYYSLVRADLEHFKERYGINTFILKKDHLPKATRRGIDYRLGERTLVFENEEYAVYEI